MAVYRKGYNFERFLKLDLESKGWKVIRSGGSKKPDLVAAKNGKIIVIECKFTSNGVIYLEKAEVHKLQEVANHFNADCIYAIHRKGSKEYIMATLDQLKEIDGSFVLRL